MYFKGTVRVGHYSVIIYVSCLGTNAPKSQRRGARSRNAQPRALALGRVHYARQRDLVAWACRGAIAIHAQRDEVQNDQIHGEEGSQGCDHNGRSIRKRVNSDKIAADDIANPKEAKEHCHRDLKGGALAPTTPARHFFFPFGLRKSKSPVYGFTSKVSEVMILLLLGNGIDIGNLRIYIRREEKEDL